MSSADKQIAEILAKYEEPFQSSVWRVQGQPVIYHKALERIAARAKITFDLPQIIRAERDEAVVLVAGRMGERAEWSLGEALVNVNYRVSGKQAGFVYAMAEKRAKDRVILKLIELHGLVYSEEEADELKANAPPVEDARPAVEAPETEPPPPAGDEDPAAGAGRTASERYAETTIEKIRHTLWVGGEALIQWWTEESGRRRSFTFAEETRAAMVAAFNARLAELRDIPDKDEIEQGARNYRKATANAPAVPGRAA